MFEWFKRWWNRPPRYIVEAEKALDEKIELLKESLEGTRLLVEVFKKEKEEESLRKERIQLSEEPEVSIIGSGLDEEKGIRLELDWNDAFIEYLRIHNIKGETDEDAIRNWLVLVVADIHQQKIEKTDREGGSFA